MEDEIDLRQYVLLLLRRRWLILGGMVLGLLAGLAFTWALPTYRVTTVLTASAPNPLVGALASSDAVLEAVIGAMGTRLPAERATPLELRKALAVTQAANSATAQLSVSDSDETRALNIAQAWNVALIEAVSRSYSENPSAALQAALQAQVKQLGDTIASLYDAEAVAGDIQMTQDRLSQKTADELAAPEDQAVLAELSLRATVGKPNVQIMLDQVPSRTVGDQVAYLAGLVNALAARRQALQARREALQAEILKTQAQLAESQSVVNTPINLQVTRTELEGPRLIRNTVLGLAVGLAAAVMLVLVGEWWGAQRALTVERNG